MTKERRNRFGSGITRQIKSTRKQITILFTDIEDSTRYWDTRGDIDGRLMVDYHNRLIFPTIKKFKGKIVKTIGDAIMASFNRSEQAVKAAIAIQQMLQNTRRQDKNWCHLEFKTFDEWSSQSLLEPYKRFYFIVTEDNVFPAHLPNEYKGWKDAIDAYLHVSDLSSLNRKEIRNKAGEIAGEIVKAKEQVLEAYIDL